LRASEWGNQTGALHEEMEDTTAGPRDDHGGKTMNMSLSSWLDQ